METNSIQSEKKKIILNKFLILIFGVLVIAVIVIYFLIIPKKSDYEKSINLIHEKKYSEAIKLLQSMSNDTGITNHFDIKGKLNYCFGMSYLNSMNYDSTEYYLSLVPKENILYKDSKITLDSLYKIPEFAYRKGIFYLENKSDIEKAFEMFSNITSTSVLYSKAQNKISYITGIKYYKNHEYVKAREQFGSVNINDDYYDKTKEYIIKVDNSMQNEINENIYNQLEKLHDNFYDIFKPTKNNYYNLEKYQSLYEELNDIYISNRKLLNLKNIFLKEVETTIKFLDIINTLNFAEDFVRRYNLINEKNNLSSQLTNLANKYGIIAKDIIKNGY